jgi:hypothetical protein
MLRPAQEFFTYMETVKGYAIKEKSAKELLNQKRKIEFKLKFLHIEHTKGYVNCLLGLSQFQPCPVGSRYFNSVPGILYYVKLYLKLNDLLVDVDSFEIIYTRNVILELLLVFSVISISVFRHQ